MAVEFIRVKAKDTGHEYSRPLDAFDPEVETKVKADAVVDGVIVAPVLNEKVGSGKQPEATNTPTGPQSGPSTV